MPKSADASNSQDSPSSDEAELRVFIIGLLTDQDYKVDQEVAVRRGLHRRVVDVVAKGPKGTLLIEVRRQPASIDAVSALAAAGWGKKFIVAPSWADETSRSLAERSRITLVKPESLAANEQLPF